MKRISVMIATILAVSTILAANNVPVPQNNSITNYSVILLPAIQPTNYTAWVSNSAFATNVYIAQYTNYVGDTGKTNYMLRYWFAKQGGTNGAYATYAPLSLSTDTYDGAVIWRPIPDKRVKAALFNIGTNAAFLGFDRAAVANKGWYLAPNGGSYITSSGIDNAPGLEAWQGEIQGITAANDLTNTITIQELPR
jgi:hypothetical protein